MVLMMDLTWHCCGPQLTATISEATFFSFSRTACNVGRAVNVSVQGVVIPIGAVVTVATGVKKWSRGQGLFLVSVKRSRTFQTW